MHGSWFDTYNTKQRNMSIGKPNIQKVTQIHPKAGHKTVMYRNTDTKTTVVTDPGFFCAKELSLLENQRIIIVITQVNLNTCARLSELKHEVGALFITHEFFLPKLQFLPQMAQKANVCGVAIPHVDEIWHEPQGVIGSTGVMYQLDSTQSDKTLMYSY